MKNKKFLLVIYILTFLFVIIGTTFAYFTTSNGSSKGVINSESAVMGINLNVAVLYNEKSLIPTNDDDIITAYNNECIDIKGFGACQAYTFTLENLGGVDEYTGTINFNLSNITNLNYLILDEDDNIYLEKTNIVPDADQPLGEDIELSEGESKTFKLVIWLPNYDYNQNAEDGGGNFGAMITYASTNNPGYVTGYISSDIEDDINE